MSWNKQLGKDWRGSRPRCILFMDGEREKVAERLTNLVGLSNVKVSDDDKWMPYSKPAEKDDDSWDKTPANEPRLNQANCLVCPEKRNQLRDWWLCHGGNTPVWDVASRCRINGKRGLILVEAKAHETELTEPNNCNSKNPDNFQRIRKAISQANGHLQQKTEGDWDLSLCGHYQLSNRFAWSWKLASLGIPVVLVYLGFLNACDMDGPNTTLFNSKTEWKRVLKNYCKDKIDNTCWGETLDVEGTPFTPLIRTCHQPFDPKNQ